MNENKWTDSPTENRERSWLKFNERVMEEADCEATPILERLKFLSIFTTNLTEFFMVRVGTLGDCEIVDPDFRENKTNMSAREQLDMIFSLAVPLYRKRDKSYERIAVALAKEGIRRVKFKEMSENERKLTERYFKTHMQPILSPAVIDVKHPFPHIPNGQLTIAAILEEKGRTQFGIIPVPNVDRLLFLNSQNTRYIAAEDILSYYTDVVFSMYSVKEKTVIRVTRNADITTDDDFADQDIDYRQHMKKLLKKRERLAPVRVETRGKVSDTFQKYLCERFQISKEHIFVSEAPLDLSYAFGLESGLPDGLRSRVCYVPFAPCLSPAIHEKESLFRQIARRDVLLSYPFESMKPLLDFIKEAADDRSVLSIKITLYRIAKESKLAEYLIRAAENGKEVFVLMELRARFDEANNIDWAQRLEDAGCRVVYGFDGFKVHSKICLITRRENGHIRHYTHIATGNYNEKTARQYTDLCLLTANQEIGMDGAEFFQNMSISNLNGTYRHLLVAPNHFKLPVLELIDREIALAAQGKPARIIAKMNSLTDKKIIDRLVSASRAGVQIQLIIRGICCLVPGVPGKTENVSVISIVGRFLEHSRVYCFGTEERAKLYIASADFMTRNTERRVEIAVPLYDERIRTRIMHMLNILLSDNVKGRDFYADGSYVLRTPGSNPPVDSQMYFAREAAEAALNMEKPAKHVSWWCRLFQRKK